MGRRDRARHLGWGFAWPDNRRTLYNRASADPEGKPWSEQKRLIWWDEEKGSWTGHDRARLPERQGARLSSRTGASSRPGMDALGGRQPFIMIADGKAALFAPSGLKDGPLPTHYEPVESPVRNPLYAGSSPTRPPSAGSAPTTRWHEPGDPRFPHALHHLPADRAPFRRHADPLVPVTAELQPEGFAEIPTELARGTRHREHSTGS